MTFLSKVAAAAIALALIAMGTNRSRAEDIYQLVIAPPTIGGNPSVFRINIASGQVSVVSSSPITSVAEPQPIPPGKYQLYMTKTPDNKTFWLYRVDTLTGRTWFDTNNTWNEVK